MRSLKNWIVTAETVKKGRDGYIAYANYLTSESKHKNQEITMLSPKSNIARTILTADKFNIKRKLSSGGRPSNYGWSVALSYPFELDNEQMDKTYRLTLFKFFKYVSEQNKLQLTDNEIIEIVAKECVSVVHRGKTVNNHIHLILPKHFKAPRSNDNDFSMVSIDLSKKKYLHRIKMLNNETINEEVGIDNINYQIDTEKVMKKRKSKSAHKRDKKILDQNQNRMNNIKSLMADIENSLKDFDTSDYDTKEEAESDLKNLSRAFTQLENGNDIRAEKTLKKVKSPRMTPR